MIDKVLVVKLLFLSLIESKTNHYVRTDTSAPELEIDQREYTNPNSVKNMSMNLTAVENNTNNDIESVDVDVSKEINKYKPPEIPSRVKKDDPSKEFKHEDSVLQYTQILDFKEDKTDDIITVASKNVPDFDTKNFMGPRRKPLKQPHFKGVGPKGIDDNDKPSCNEFSRHARFNPYSVLNQKWFNFYRWDMDTVPMVIEFFAPTSWELANIRRFVDKQVTRPVSWASRIVIMIDLLYNMTSLLVERSDHGQFWMYPIRPNYTGILAPEDLRMKQTADNRYIALVLCEDDRAFIFSRINEVPRKSEIPDAVASVGWRGRDGRSYLYQGHKWMPIPEIDEEEYWTPKKYKKEEYLPPPPEPYDPTTDNVKIFGN